MSTDVHSCGWHCTRPACVRTCHGELEYLSWFGYSPLGVCPQCGTVWTDVMFAYDGAHCTSSMTLQGGQWTKT